LTVNLKKTKIVCFHVPKAFVMPPTVFQDQEVERVPQYKYLGAVFHERKGLKLAAEGLVDAGRAAMHAMLRRCAELRVRDPRTKTRLFTALVQPVLSYACDIWGVELIKLNQGKPTIAEHDLLFVSFLKRLLGVSPSTMNCAAFAEFGLYPLRLFWMKMVLRYWNRLVQSSPQRLIHHAFCESMALAVNNKNSWVGHVQRLFAEHPCLGVFCPAVPVDVRACMAALQSDYLEREQQYEGSKTGVYWSIKGVQQYSCERYLGAVSNTHQRRALAQFRTGSHWLPVQTMRGMGVARADRHCKLCSMGVLGDEHHMLFDCPVMDDMRAKMVDVFAQARTVTEFCSLEHSEKAIAVFLETSRLRHLRHGG
jgi:hypothetical protein